MADKASLLRKRKMVSACWVWSGKLTKDGYARTSHNGKTVRVHRLAYELWVGSIPEGLEIDHTCRNRACFNPEHLEATTHTINVQRGRHGWKGRRTHCPRGHSFVGAPRESDGSRRCRVCRRENQNARYHARKDDDLSQI
jgi:hypothetical protein